MPLENQGNEPKKILLRSPSSSKVGASDITTEGPADQTRVADTMKMRDTDTSRFKRMQPGAAVPQDGTKPTQMKITLKPSAPPPQATSSAGEDAPTVKISRPPSSALGRPTPQDTPPTSTDDASANKINSAPMPRPMPAPDGMPGSKQTIKLRPPSDSTDGASPSAMRPAPSPTMKMQPSAAPPDNDRTTMVAKTPLTLSQSPGMTLKLRPPSPEQTAKAPAPADSDRTVMVAKTPMTLSPAQSGAPNAAAMTLKLTSVSSEQTSAGEDDRTVKVMKPQTPTILPGSQSAGMTLKLTPPSSTQAGQGGDDRTVKVMKPQMEPQPPPQSSGVTLKLKPVTQTNAAVEMPHPPEAKSTIKLMAPQPTQSAPPSALTMNLQDTGAPPSMPTMKLDDSGTSSAGGKSLKLKVSSTPATEKPGPPQVANLPPQAGPDRRHKAMMLEHDEQPPLFAAISMLALIVLVMSFWIIFTQLGRTQWGLDLEAPGISGKYAPTPPLQ